MCCCARGVTVVVRGTGVCTISLQPAVCLCKQENKCCACSAQHMYHPIVWGTRGESAILWLHASHTKFRFVTREEGRSPKRLGVTNNNRPVVDTVKCLCPCVMYPICFHHEVCKRTLCGTRWYIQWYCGARKTSEHHACIVCK